MITLVFSVFFLVLAIIAFGLLINTRDPNNPLSRSSGGMGHKKLRQTLWIGMCLFGFLSVSNLMNYLE